MKIGVVGAGKMGRGIAQVFAQTEGYSVVLSDISMELADKGKAAMSDGLAKLVSRGRMTQEAMDKTVASVVTGTTKDMADCDLVIEVALERMDIKKTLFAELQAICRPDTIFTSNTSSLSLTEMSQGLDRPVVGMHFFNPPPVMKLVEVIAGYGTPPELTDKVFQIAEEIGKTPIRVQEGPGFIVNRLLIPVINEASCILSEGLASAEDIDQAMLLGANHPIGPLALGDLIGLDVCLAIMETLYNETLDAKFRPSVLLRKMVRSGNLGRKTGKGFYDYSKK